MPRDPRYDPVVWLTEARDHLTTASIEAVPVRVRCFHGQRAVELTFKAIILHHGLEYPHSHTLHRLIALIPGGVPPEVDDAAQLTAYAVEEMYPDTYIEQLDDSHANEALRLAQVVIDWAATIIEPND